MDKLKSYLRVTANKLIRTGFFSIYLSSIACNVLTFLGGMVVVRVLSKGEYGSYTYIINCYGMLLLFNDLGCCVATMQFCNERYDQPEKRDAIFLYGFKKGLQFGSISSILLFLSPYFYPFQQPEAAQLTRYLCFMPFLNIANSFLLVNLRAQLKNNLYAKINVFSTFIHYVIILPMAYWLGIEGAVFSNYVISGLTLFYGLWTSRGLLHFPGHGGIDGKDEKKAFLKLAFGSQLNNSMTTGLMLLDVFLIGIFIADSEVTASYKVATTIPSALMFIPDAAKTYLIPYFVHHRQDKAWVKKNYFRYILCSAGVNFILVCGLVLIGPWIIPLVFGKQYADAVACFTILMAGYFFMGSFQSPSSGVVYTQRKVRINIAVTILSGLANCLLDIVLILNYGSIGAAWATTIVHILSSAMYFGYMCHYLKK